MNFKRNNLIFAVTLGVCMLFGNANANAKDKEGVDIEFNVTVPKNTCDILIEGTSQNVIDFGSIALARLKSDSAEGKVKLPFSIKLAECKNNDFANNYITLDGNYVVENNGFLDDPGERTFAIRISDKETATQADDVFFDKNKNKIWTNIQENVMEKQFYAYLMCKNGLKDCASDANIGQFKSTFTLTYMVD
ncbi:TPA: fimbrial protein [Providencia stuartii]